MQNDIHTLKENLRIPEVWHRLGLPGEPSLSCRAPFRPDKSPSFSVYDDGRRWKDHGTGEGGDVIDFIANAFDIAKKEAYKRFIVMAGGAALESAPRLRHDDAAAKPRVRTDLAEKKGMLKKEGNRLVFVTSEGEIIKQFRKAWEANEDGCLDKVMTDFKNIKTEVSTADTAEESH